MQAAVLKNDKEMIVSDQFLEDKPDQYLKLLVKNEWPFARFPVLTCLDPSPMKRRISDPATGGLEAGVNLNNCS